jgi:hypothetical protein
MKQISVRVSEDFAREFKMKVLKEGTTTQEVLKNLLESWLTNSQVNKLTTNTSTSINTNIASEQVNTPTSEQSNLLTSDNVSNTESEQVNKLTEEPKPTVPEEEDWRSIPGRKSKYR